MQLSVLLISNIWGVTTIAPMTLRLEKPKHGQYFESDGENLELGGHDEDPENPAVSGNIIFYGSETWTIPAALSKQIDGCYTRMLQMAVNIRWHDKVSNDELYVACQGKGSLIAGLWTHRKT